LQLTQFNNPPRKIKNNMTTQHLKKSIGRSPLRLGFFLPALAAACFALLPFATADAARECGRWPNVTNEGNRPRARTIHIVGDPNGDHFTTTKPCVPEKVLLSGGVVVKFKVQAGKLEPVSAELKNFHGEGLGSGPGSHREYVAKVSFTETSGSGTFFGSRFHVIVQVTAKPNKALPNQQFFLKWTVRYSSDKDTRNLTRFALFDGLNPQCEPQVKCKLDES
jgi:hypothetical protein